VPSTALWKWTEPFRISRQGSHHASKAAAQQLLSVISGIAPCHWSFNSCGKAASRTVGQLARASVRLARSDTN
jgi:hypothetical protein